MPTSTNERWLQVKDIIPRARQACHAVLQEHDNRSANCVRTTLIFTHPHLARKIRLEGKITHDRLEAISRRLAKMSQSRVNLKEYSREHPLTTNALERSLASSHAAWISTAGDSTAASHIYGIMRASRSQFFIWDAEGKLSPVKRTKSTDFLRHLQRRVRHDRYYYGEIFAFVRNSP